MIQSFFVQEIKANPNNYDAWFDYIRLMENESTADAVRETYERAISNIPPSQVKVTYNWYQGISRDFISGSNSCLYYPVAIVIPLV